MIQFFLRVRSREFLSKTFLSALIVAPHPDDETFGCGGLISKMASNESALRVVFVSDGSASHPRHPTLSPVELARLRKNEAIASTSILGIPASSLVFLEAKDGTLDCLSPDESARVVTHIASILANDRPDAVFVPCRDDGSSEHEASFVLVEEAIKMSGHKPRLLEYPIWAWWSPVLLARISIRSHRVWRTVVGESKGTKIRAIAAYVSQTQPIFPGTDSVLPTGFPEIFQSSDEYFFER
jgi:LmbE family N-acetylglucosaminyl deacetylase